MPFTQFLVEVEKKGNTQPPTPLLAFDCRNGKLIIISQSICSLYNSGCMLFFSSLLMHSFGAYI